MITQRGLIEEKKVFHPMPVAKLESILTELPWLRVWLTREKETIHAAVSQEKYQIDQIFVSGIDSSFSSMQPLLCTKTGDSFGGGRNILHCPTAKEGYQSEFIFLLDKSGKVVTFEVPVPKYIKFCLFWKKNVGTMVEEWRCVVSPGAKVGAYLAGSKDEIYYAVSYLSYTRTIIAYKPPRGLSINGWLRESAPAEKAVFQAELEGNLAKIDAIVSP